MFNFDNFLQSFGLILLVFGFFLYFLPIIVAGTRNHRYGNWILVINLLLGWTLLGWLAAFFWAINTDIDSE